MEIFIDGHSINIAYPPVFQVTRIFMVNSMFLSPVVIRGKSKYTTEQTAKIVSTLASKKGSVSAVMLNNKQSNGKPGSRKSKQKRDPVTEIKRIEHDQPDEDKRNERIG